MCETIDSTNNWIEYNANLLDNVSTLFEHDDDENGQLVFQLNLVTKFSDYFDWNLYSIEIAIVLNLAMKVCPLELYILLRAIISSI